MKRNVLLGLFIISLFVSSLSFVTIQAESTSVDPQSMLMARYCTITNPDNGEIVSGFVTITVDASSIPRITIDGAVVARAYSYVWDTTGYTDGTHTIQAKARGASDTNVVTVSNGGTINTPPTVIITAPANGATVSGTTTISVSVSDEDFNENSISSNMTKSLEIRDSLAL